MATTRDFKTHWKELGLWRSTMAAAFYANSVREIGVAEAYELASKQPEVIVTDEPLHNPGDFGLPADAKVLVINDGGITGRTASARRLVADMDEVEQKKFHTVLKEAMHNLTVRPCIRGSAVVGLDPHYMVRAHFLTPETNAMDMFNWMVNFTPYEQAKDAYANSRGIDGYDIVIVADPDWTDPSGKVNTPVVIMDPSQQCVCVLGLRYFGEKKKGTLTLGWDLGVRLGMVACHAGVKKVVIKENGDLVEKAISFFGLSGSGKSSLTNNFKHNGKINEDEGEEVTIVHDDAFVIDIDNNKVVAMEPTLFDKTDSTEPFSDELRYFLSAQNQLVAEVDGKKRIITWDARNPNGRAIKSRDWIGRIDNTCKAPDFICWLMKDPLLPPIVYLDDPDMAVAMGACLSTKRTAAENVPLEEMKHLVIEPFANPFRVYPLATDCERFKRLFEVHGKGYILNTGFFRGTKVPKELSLELVVNILRQDIEFVDWLPGMKLAAPGVLDDVFTPPNDADYWSEFASNCADRIAFLEKNEAPAATIDAIRKLKAAAESRS